MVYARAAHAAPSLHDLCDLQRRHHWSISSVPTVLWREDHTVLKVDMPDPASLHVSSSRLFTPVHVGVVLLSVTAPSLGVSKDTNTRIVFSSLLQCLFHRGLVIGQESRLNNLSTSIPRLAPSLDLPASAMHTTWD